MTLCPECPLVCVTVWRPQGTLRGLAAGFSKAVVSDETETMRQSALCDGRLPASQNTSQPRRAQLS